jgi:uncharacterized membrane protein
MTSRQGRQKGQSVVMVVLTLALVLVGALGLAVDVSNMYVERQMAQAAADSAAQAVMMSVFKGTDTSGNSVIVSSLGAQGHPLPAQTAIPQPLVYPMLLRLAEWLRTSVRRHRYR